MVVSVGGWNIGVALTSSRVRCVRKVLNERVGRLRRNVLSMVFSRRYSCGDDEPFLETFPARKGGVVLKPKSSTKLMSVASGCTLTMKVRSRGRPSTVRPCKKTNANVKKVLESVVSVKTVPVTLLSSLEFKPLRSRGSECLFRRIIGNVSSCKGHMNVPAITNRVRFSRSFEAGPLMGMVYIKLIRGRGVMHTRTPGVNSMFLLVNKAANHSKVRKMAFTSRRLASSSRARSEPTMRMTSPFAGGEMLRTSLRVLRGVGIDNMGSLNNKNLAYYVSRLISSSDGNTLISLHTVPLERANVAPCRVVLSRSRREVMFIVGPSSIRLTGRVYSGRRVSSSIVKRMVRKGGVIVSSSNSRVTGLPAVLLTSPPSVSEPVTRVPTSASRVSIGSPPVFGSIPTLLSDPGVTSGR